MTITGLDRSFTRWDELLALILTAFAPMNGRIDPPSSALSLTAEALAAKAEAEIGHVAIDNGKLTGCLFLRPEADCLYVGKLAVLPQAQGKGLGRRLLEIAEETAAELGLAALRLETRIELVDNHAVFAAWGFSRTAEKAHPGFTRTTFIEMRKSLAR
ncbi:GNAT family N-acetyltransferase [Rhizobium bangladeshense]|uniref:GNAT family N-acetyltransferase n=1 Tax=Rhizobium bangladeshense TaxID=1138189 RepID=UPI001C83FED0|nr:GNAT family N-acetyltransferase [Rhizobium bangladeshense]MBX4889424.1 GNAT family N-acetyltransferase [Rhizobium bangladeshense]MBX4898554.1 GNAT family N-acetyltransferase [Rhizobium bangladeshense]MBX4918737.1 GNAT family N-acetyltransferase [Rhizobium bangladeshense]MBY3599699.1 GNAT family N-acetyltransferase [Rhizobium bangladeshense]MBY3616577.1 GNAT family N-acetyltransferase [Rhizobium bangladeshense]